MSVRNIEYQLEAKLEGKSSGFFSAKPRGKLERKSYEGGVERLKVKVSNLKVSDGRQVVVTSDRVEIARITIKDGRGKFDEESTDSSVFPALTVGQTIEISVNNKPLLTGVLYED